MSIQNVNVNVFIYSPKSRCKHAVHQTLHITFPGVGTHSFFQSHLPRKNAANFLQLKPSLFRSTRYPSLLGGQRQYGFKACPRLLRIYYIPTLVSGMEPQTFQSVVRRLYPFGHALHTIGTGNVLHPRSVMVPLRIANMAETLYGKNFSAYLNGN